MKKMSTFNTNTLLHTIFKWSSIILVILTVILLSILSFVKNLGLDVNARNITTIAVIGVVLNYLIWDTFYKEQYSRVMKEDTDNSLQKKYSIHKRYYDARKGFTQAELRAHIHKYNQEFTQSWLEDVEDVTGRKIEDTYVDKKLVDVGIRNGRYKGNSHKLLIWRIKHRRYPKSGVKSPRQLLNMLSVGKSNSMKMHTNGEVVYHGVGRASKVITSGVGMFFSASIVYDFISEGWQKAIIGLIIGLILIVASSIFGSTSGVKGAQIKLSATEEVCELLEEWKGTTIDIEKYGDFESISEVDKKVEILEVEQRTISIE